MKNKNIWLLPTDKPSRIYLNTGEWFFENDYSLSVDECINQNIYITDDSEIKEGDWFYDLDTKYIKIKQSWENSHLDFNAKKIILTTDVDLIKDGVQPITDEFLEWFVKNPSCEFVNIVPYDGYSRKIGSYSGYEIIIPKEEPKQEDCSCTDECLGYLTKTCKRIEEPKQETFTNDTDSDSWGFENFEVIKTKEDAKIFVETMENIPEPNDKLKKAFRDFNKQETLEELAERIYTTELVMDVDISESLQSAFINGYKTCEEQNKNLYSEEDMINFAYHYMNERKDFGAIAFTPELLIKYLKKK